MKASQKPEVIIYTDGACKKNGLYGGCAAVMICGMHSQIVYQNMNNTTSPRTEIMAVIEGLKTLMIPCNVKIISDCAYVVDTINNYIYTWKKNGWKTTSKKKAKNTDLWKTILNYMSIHNIQAEHVKGHDGDTGNETADFFAQHACYIKPS